MQRHLLARPNEDQAISQKHQLAQEAQRGPKIRMLLREAANQAAQVRPDQAQRIVFPVVSAAINEPLANDQPHPMPTDHHRPQASPAHHRQPVAHARSKPAPICPAALHRQIRLRTAPAPATPAVANASGTSDE